MFSRLISRDEESFIRPMRPEHIPACVRLHAQSFARGWGADEFDALLMDPGVLAHVAVDGQGRKLHGFAMSRMALDEAELLTIAVDSALRGQGKGRILLRNHLTALRGVGIVTIFLEVEEANAAARALYDRNGFAVVGQRDGYYAKADGTRAKALVMKKNQ
jgi:ribosomal-protein-alanine N-acetyltransferase